MTSLSSRQAQALIGQHPRQQIRLFVIVWTAIALIMGMVTFLAIYFTYRPAGSNSTDFNAALPPESLGEAVVMIPSVTSQPVTATLPPATVVAQAASTAVPTGSGSAAGTGNSNSQPNSGPVMATNANQDTAQAAEEALSPMEDRRFQLGIQVQHALDYNQDVMDGYYGTVVDNLGLTWIKTQVRWEDTESAKGVFDWIKMDFIMENSEKFGVKQMLSIVTAPDWARESGINTTQDGPPANNQDYVDFVVALIERYPGQINAIEVWNEQNLAREWTSIGGISAANYVQLLKESYTAIKAADPDIIVISGALTPTGVDDGIISRDDFTYLDRMISNGMLDYADCVGVHANGYNLAPTIRYEDAPRNPDPTARFRGPYDNPHHSWSFRSTLDGYAARVTNAGSDTELCITEFGWAVSEDIGGFPPGYEYAADNTLEEQATYFVEALDSMSEADNVWLAFIWNFNYGPNAGWDPNNDNVVYSMIGPGSTFRPSFDAVRDWYASYRETVLDQPEADS